MTEERIIGRKAILRIFAPMYDIHTWPGTIKFIKKNKLPLRKTPANRPMFYKHELIQYDQKFQNLLNSLP